MAEIKDSDIKKLDAEKRVIMSTGFRNVDTAIAYRLYDPYSDQLMKINRGLLSGGMLTLIGKSHTGKSTWLCQVAANLIRPYMLMGDKRVKLHYFDTEGGIDYNRFRVISKLTPEQMSDHVIMEDRKTLEQLKKVILEDIKEKSDKSYKPIKTINHTNDPIFICHPTVIVLDSVTKLITEKVADIGKDTNQSMYMQMAGELDRFLKQYGDVFIRYNIILLSTAHSGTKVDTSTMPNMQPKKAWKYLPANLDIKAPDCMIYEVSFGINLETILASNPKQIDEKLSAGWLDAIAVIEGRFYKTRQPGEGSTFTLVQDQKGFSPEKSFLFECQRRKILQSKPGYREVEGYGKVKNSEIVSTFMNDQNFRKALYLEFDKIYEEQLESGRLSVEEVNVANTIQDLLLEEF